SESSLPARRRSCPVIFHPDKMRSGPQKMLPRPLCPLGGPGQGEGEATREGREAKPIRCDPKSLLEEVKMSDVIRVAVTGAAGQVAYSMLGRLASGEVFGTNRKIVLQLLEIPQAMTALEGVAMELDDCSFPTLADMVVTDDPARA